MTTVKEIYAYFNERLPASLSCSWDNDGLMVCACENAGVQRALFALDVTDAVADYAIRNRYDLIVTHHPLIFSPLRNLSGADAIGARALRLYAGGISVFSFHTRLDATQGGVNDILADIFSLSNVRRFGPEGEEMGRIGELEREMPLADFCALVKEKISRHISVGACGNRVKTVALLGGSGGDFLSSARAAGADTFLTGELNYHTLMEPAAKGMSLIAVGHYESEVPVFHFYQKEFATHFPEVALDAYPDGCPIIH